MVNHLVNREDYFLTMNPGGFNTDVNMSINTSRDQSSKKNKIKLKKKKLSTVTGENTNRETKGTLRINSSKPRGAVKISKNQISQFMSKTIIVAK
jgi:hypothetical protein